MNAEKLALESRRAPALAALRARFNASHKATAYTIIADTPAWVKRNTAHGTRASGFTYENKVGKYLSELCSKSGWKLWDHQWFAYICGKDLKYFQPDFIIERPSKEWIVIEVKLTYVDTFQQLQKYVDYLKLWEMEGENINFTCFPVTIVRNLIPNIALPIVDSFDKISSNSVLHLWL